MLFLLRMVRLKRDALTVPALPKPEPAIARHSLEDAAETGSKRAAQALATIRKLVEEGRFPPGSKLPAERKFAEQLSVGRPVVREALKVLTTLGIVESRARSGTYVKSVQVTQSFAAGNWSETRV